jgi:hypothetical protein
LMGADLVAAFILSLFPAAGFCPLSLTPWEGQPCGQQGKRAKSYVSVWEEPGSKCRAGTDLECARAVVCFALTASSAESQGQGFVSNGFRIRTGAPL